MSQKTDVKSIPYSNIPYTENQAAIFYVINVVAYIKMNIIIR